MTARELKSEQQQIFREPTRRQSTQRQSTIEGSPKVRRTMTSQPTVSENEYPVIKEDADEL